MKRTFLFDRVCEPALVTAGALLIAATYGLVRLAYGLLLPEIDRDLALGATLGGLISAGASAAYCLGATTGFLLGAERPRGVVLLAAASAGTGAVGMSLAWSGPVFAAFAVASSVGAGAASPALVAIVQRSIRADHLDRAQSSINAGTGPGLVAAGLLALVVLPHWRIAWVVAALVTTAAAAAVLVLERRAAPADAVPPAVLPAWSWYRLHRVPLVAALLLGSGSAVVWTFGRSHLVRSGLGDTGSILAWIVLGAGGAAAIATARPLSRIPPPAAWTATAATTALGTTLIATSPGGPAATSLGCALFGWGFVAATSALIAWARWLDPGQAPAGTALLFVALVVGQSAGAAAAGALAEQAGFGITIVLGAAVSGVAAGTPLLLRQPQPALA